MMGSGVRFPASAPCSSCKTRVRLLEDRLAEVATMIADAAPEITAFAGFPPEHWRQIWP